MVGVYLLVFLTGDKKAEPKLGIDLQGGTRVTLTARTPDGSRPTRDALAQAQEIITSRVNGLGVSGSEVVVDGDNLVITVPGNDSSEARNLGQTARLYIRPVIHAIPAAGQTPPAAPGAPGAPGAPPGARGFRGLPPGMPPGVPGTAPAEPEAPIVPPTPGLPPRPAPAPPNAPAPPQPRPFPQEPPSPNPAPPSPEPAPAPNPAPPSGPAPGPAPSPVPKPPNAKADLAQRIADEKTLRQSTDQNLWVLALQFQATRCNDEDVLAGNDDPNLPLVTCSQDHKQVYLLDKSIISGEQIESASSGLDQQRGEYVVDLQFKSQAADIWANFTAANVGTQ